LTSSIKIYAGFGLGMFGCETTAVQSSYILLIFMQKNTILADFLPCFLLFLPFLQNILNKIFI
jgi:hypothetical protein